MLAGRFPRLSAVAMKYLCIPATSCASESLFSSARHTCRYDRGRLTGETIKGLLFLKHALREHKNAI